jgi:aryl-alcohol dehydrogenase-like predicted oxidoreductase
MDYRTLATTGTKVTPLCLGAMMFGAWGNPDHEDSIRIIHRALDAGINFIDTADVYSRGESEEIVGKALAGGRRDDVVLATKVHGTMGEDPNQFGNSRRWIIKEVEASLRRLRTLARLADEAQITLIEMAIAFAIRHPAVTSAIIGPRTLEHLESQLTAADVVLSDDVLDRIDEIVPPGVNVNPADGGWPNPGLEPVARRG